MKTKSIFITGAASGIGKETALYFAKKKWFVGLYDVNEHALLSLHKQIGENSCFRKLDVTDHHDVKRAFEHYSFHTKGRMNVLLNCAGLFQVGPFELFQNEAHLDIIDVNVKGVLNCTYHALPFLKNTTPARVINMSSGSSCYGLPDFASYSATKFWVRGFTEALNGEWARYGIIVSDIISPGVNTPMMKELHTKNDINLLNKKLIRPQSVAKVIWKAVHGKRVHRVVGLNFSFQYNLLRCMPDWFKSWAFKALYSNYRKAGELSRDTSENGLSSQ